MKAGGSGFFDSWNARRTRAANRRATAARTRRVFIDSAGWADRMPYCRRFGNAEISRMAERRREGGVGFCYPGLDGGDGWGWGRQGNGGQGNVGCGGDNETDLSAAFGRSRSKWMGVRFKTSRSKSLPYPAVEAGDAVVLAYGWWIGFQTFLKPYPSKSLTLAVANSVTPKARRQRAVRVS